ncbi:MAG: hypothetical protein BGN87_23565 [Rhizobiales bacterium 65-79]|nr:MAG: hypothetical protein BGN87_23565 [Rhizobiales bacterium 65-79]
MGQIRIEEERVSLAQDLLLIIDVQFDNTLQHKTKFLAKMFNGLLAAPFWRNHVDVDLEELFWPGRNKFLKNDVVVGTTVAGMKFRPFAAANNEYERIAVFSGGKQRTHIQA